MCVRKISTRPHKRTWMRVYKSYLTSVRARDGRGNDVTWGKRRYRRRCQHGYEIAGAIRDFPDPRRRRIHLNVITWN